MIGQNNLGTIKNMVNEFFDRTNFEIGIEFLEQKENTIFIKLKTDDPKILIGQNGQTLAEIQHLLKAVMRKKIETPLYIDVDINSYKERKYEYLKEIAKSLADEVSINRKEKALSPMPASERRIIHMELANREDVITESIGEGFQRRLVIKPA